jgi:hypothetical protein
MMSEQGKKRLPTHHSGEDVREHCFAGAHMAAALIAERECVLVSIVREPLRGRRGNREQIRCR